MSDTMCPHLGHRHSFFPAPLLCGRARLLLNSFQAKTFIQLPGQREASGRTIHMHVAHLLSGLISTWMGPELTPRQHAHGQGPRESSLWQLVGDCRLLNSISQHSNQIISHLQYCTKEKKNNAEHSVHGRKNSSRKLSHCLVYFQFHSPALEIVIRASQRRTLASQQADRSLGSGCRGGGCSWETGSSLIDLRGPHGFTKKPKETCIQRGWRAARAGHSGMQMGCSFQSHGSQPPPHTEIITLEVWKIMLSRGSHINLHMWENCKELNTCAYVNTHTRVYVETGRIWMGNFGALHQHWLSTCGVVLCAF